MRTALERPWRAAILLAVLLSGGYLLVSSQSSMWDRDEPRFARSAVEMLESGNYLVPTLNGETWPDKPVLTYWFMSLAIAVLGPTELAVRFFAGIGMSISALLVFYIAKRLFDARIALWSMLIFASSIMIFVLATLGTSDSILMPWMLMAMAGFVHSLDDSRVRPVHLLVIGAGLGLAALTKGPMAVLPALVIAVFIMACRRTGCPLKFGWRHLGVSVGIAALVMGFWAVPAQIATGGEFLRVFVGRHVLHRATTPMENHGGNFFLYLPYYIPMVIAGFFPWSMHLSGSISALLGNRLTARREKILLMSWAIPVFVLMSLAATKLPHYVVFIWPALAIATAAVVCAPDEALKDRDRRWLRGGIWFFIPLAGPAAAALLAFALLDLPIQHRFYAVLPAVVLIFVSIAAIKLQLRNKQLASAKALLAGMLVFHAALLTVMPSFEQIKISRPLAARIRETTSKEVPIAAYGYGEPSFNFYIAANIECIRNDREFIAWTRTSAPGIMVVPDEQFERLQNQYGPLELKSLAHQEGLNMSKGKPIRVLALRRN